MKVSAIAVGVALEYIEKESSKVLIDMGNVIYYEVEVEGGKTAVLSLDCENKAVIISAD